jgi:hypothetical protein
VAPCTFSKSDRLHAAMLGRSEAVGGPLSRDFFWATADYPESLFRAIVDSVKIDDSMVEAALAASEG